MEKEVQPINKDFWNEYWKNYQYKKSPIKVLCSRYMRKLYNKKSFIEIGGFPGTNAAYFYQNTNCKDVSFLDFHTEKQIVNKLEEINNLPKNTIKCIDADFFKYESIKRYDVVFSTGFIEHFENTQEVLEKHVHLLSETGALLVTLPNFRGLNGFLNKIFDKENLYKHNLNSMNIKYLKNILKQIGLRNIEVSYFRRPMLWLEPKPTIKNKILRLAIKLITLCLQLVPIKCKLLSPHIIMFAEK